MPLGLFSRVSSKKDTLKSSSTDTKDEEGNRSPKTRQKKTIDNNNDNNTNHRSTSSSPSRPSKRTSSSPKQPSKQQPSPTSSPTTSTNAVTWTEAHRQTCVSQGTLVLSLDQVIREGGFSELRNHPHCSDPNTILWEERPKALRDIVGRFSQDNTTDNVVAAAIDKAETQQPPQDTTEGGPSVYSRLSSVASTVTKMANVPFDFLTSPLADTDDYDDVSTDVYTATSEDLDTRPSADGNTFVWVHNKEPLLHVDLTLQCLSYLKTCIELEVPVPIFTTTEMQAWIQNRAQQDNASEIAKLVSQLPPTQSAFLLDVLVASNVVQKEEQTAVSGMDLILFPDPVIRQDVRVSIYNLDKTCDKLQQRIQVLRRHADSARQAAIQQRNGGYKKEALLQLKRHKLYEREIESNYQKLTVMEQQKVALESASETHLVHEAMKQTAETLKTMRLSKATDSQESTMDALHDELEHVKESELALTSPMEELHADLFDEDELLKELESYQQAEEDDIDADELLQDIATLQLSEDTKTSKSTKKKPTKEKPKKAPGSPTHAASLYGSTETKAASQTKEPKQKESPKRNRWGSNRNKKKEEDEEKPKEEKKLAAAVAM